jgi:hypothetical protein
LRKAFQKGETSLSRKQKKNPTDCSIRAETRLRFKKGGSEVAKSGGCTAKKKIRKSEELLKRKGVGKQGLGVGVTRGCGYQVWE